MGRTRALLGRSVPSLLPTSHGLQLLTVESVPLGESLFIVCVRLLRGSNLGDPALLLLPLVMRPGLYEQAVMGVG